VPPYTFRALDDGRVSRTPSFYNSVVSVKCEEYSRLRQLIALPER